MRKTILTILGSALLAGSFIQAAAASEHRHVRKIHRAAATVSQSFRDSLAYARRAPTAIWPAPADERDWSSHGSMDEALSPPAGH
jgi:hypothetical protein